MGSDFASISDYGQFEFERLKIGEHGENKSEGKVAAGKCAVDTLMPSLDQTETISSRPINNIELIDKTDENFLTEDLEHLFSNRNDLKMGSGVSVNRPQKPLHDDDLIDRGNDGPSSLSLEVCPDQELEEAEGIAHARLVTFPASFDNGVLTFDDLYELPNGFGSILDEYINPSKPHKPNRPKLQGRINRNVTAEEGNQKSGLNLTLTGSKAKRVERTSTSCLPSRGLVTRNRQRNRNPNSMKSMQDRLEKSVRSSATKRPNWNQNASAVEKKTCSKAVNVRRNIRRLGLFAAIKPSNLDEEKERFFASNFTINPKFEYRYPANETALSRYNNASTLYLEEATAILHRVLKRYGNYESFETATGGRLLNKTEIWNTVKRYLEREGFYGDVVVDISNDLLSRAAMTIVGGRPTLSIRESSAREYWVDGLLRHEVGTHHLRFHNNRQQSWHNANIRRQMELLPANPTEEGLASIHSVLLRKDPSLWRAAMLYYAVHKASRLSFVELFNDLGQFLDSPEVRWDYCLRTKRGQTDTSKPGCFCKDQVYLTGILALLQRRKTLDFHMLCMLGKVSHEDVDRLQEHCNRLGTKIPSFMKDIDEYRRRLDYIVNMNGLERFLKPSKAESSD